MKATFQQIAASHLVIEHTNMVQVRAIFVSLLTAVLLSYSCASAACESKCASTLLGPGCHNRASRAETDRPAVMAGMPHSARHSLTDEVETISIGSSCQHHICAKDFLFFGKSSFEKATTTKVTRPVMLYEARFLPPSEGMWLPVRGSPPMPPSSQIALRTTLRV